MGTLTYTGRLVITSCWCGIALAIPEGLYDQAHRTRQNVYCPVGHSFVYGDLENDRLKRETARLSAELDQARANAEHQRRRVQGYQGALVKSKKRAVAGLCPAPGCKRSFADVERHVRTKHPDYEPHVVDEAVAVD